MTATDSGACPASLSTLEQSFLADSSGESMQASVKQIHFYIDLLDQLRSEAIERFPESAAIRSSVTLHAWNNLLNNAIISLDCLDGMLATDRNDAAIQLLPRAVRSLRGLGIH
ncbi:hypothetical protein Poly51_19410 [Rubripirellula tenax]|uniref:Uncharacterized protein n=1 Tax=Rubripirellula tenax TaxID=2528015 RepID=A0A5C6FCM0_9BACT|nr:hypothetical protein [Rubripirellula tenax]TWU59155.1 hypothetical protein Poly51_19410 [Rubripirellula tenax]